MLHIFMTTVYQTFSQSSYGEVCIAFAVFYWLSCVTTDITCLHLNRVMISILCYAVGRQTRARHYRRGPKEDKFNTPSVSSEDRTFGYARHVYMYDLLVMFDFITCNLYNF